MCSTVESGDQEMACAHNPYGDGKAADRILEICKDFFIQNRSANNVKY